MKKQFTALALALLLILSLLAGCSASGSSESRANYGGEFAQADLASTAEAAPQESAEPGYGYDDAVGERGVTADGETKSVDMSEKIIYSMNAYIETMDYDASVKKVSELLERFGGFVESSSVSGVNYASKHSGYVVSRTASYTLRVPANNFSGMTDALSEIGNVTNRSTYADNVTAEFYDSQSRLNAYRTEEERLLSMLEKVDTIEAMIAIESRLSDVRYNIESLQTQLTNWQNQVDYSTVELEIAEVAELTEDTPIIRTYWQQVGDGVTDSLKGIASFFKNFLKFFLSALPVLIVLAVFALIAWRIVRAVIKKQKNGKTPPSGGGQSDK